LIFTITVVALEIGTVNPTSGSTNDKIKINGLFFRTKKREVTIRGKIRVLSWTMDPMTGEGEIQFFIHSI
jgi:phosphopantothenate synthetase